MKSPARLNTWLQRIILSTDVDAPSTWINWSTMLILADRTNGRDIATVLCPSVCHLSVRRNVCIVATCMSYRKNRLKKQTGNGLWGIKWSRDWWRHIALKGECHDPNMFGPISSTAAERLQIQTWLQWRPWEDKVMTLICLGLKYLKNSWRCYFATVANYSTVLSAILAWLLVC